MLPIAAIQATVTTPVMLAALVGGAALALVGPTLVIRMARGGTTVSPAARWSLIFIVEVVAATLLFTAGHAFGVIPALATAAKIGIIAMSALVLAGIAAVLQRS